MFRIECNGDITVTKGDKGFINFRCANYRLIQGDTVVFYCDNLRIDKRVTEFTEKGFAAIDLETEDTNHNKGTYDYVIRVITANGIDETVISGKYSII